MNTCKITATQFDFILEYTPANSHFTSLAECDAIITALNLKSYSAVELRHLRNNVVEVYTQLMDEEIMFDSNGKYKGRTDKFFEYLAGMQSVTAVIDNVMYSR